MRPQKPFKQFLKQSLFKQYIRKGQLHVSRLHVKLILKVYLINLEPASTKMNTAAGLESATMSSPSQQSRPARPQSRCFLLCLST